MYLMLAGVLSTSSPSACFCSPGGVLFSRLRPAEQRQTMPCRLSFGYIDAGTNGGCSAGGSVRALTRGGARAQRVPRDLAVDKRFHWVHTDWHFTKSREMYLLLKDGLSYILDWLSVNGGRGLCTFCWVSLFLSICSCLKQTVELICWWQCLAWPDIVLSHYSWSLSSAVRWP